MPTITDIPPMDTDPMVPTPTTDLMDTTLLARGLLMLSPLLMLMPTTTDIPPMDTDPMVPTPTTDLMDITLLARGLLMLVPTTTDIPPMDTDPMVLTPTTDLMDITLLARGLLMLSPLLMPTTTDMLLPMPTDPMVLTPTEPDTTDTGKLPISTKDLPSSRNENQLPQPATKDLKFPFLFVPLIPFSAFKFMYHHM